jgi:hypothetical protein
MDEQVEIAAREIVERYGSQAVDIAARRADDLARRGDWPGQDVAMRVLNWVEKLARSPCRPV